MASTQDIRRRIKSVKNIQPVSYTHLDVYKRQGGLAIYFAFMVAALFTVDLTKEVVGLLTGATVIPVSYTHLDVYKRQILGGNS